MAAAALLPSLRARCGRIRVMRCEGSRQLRIEHAESGAMPQFRSSRSKAKRRGVTDAVGPVKMGSVSKIDEKWHGQFFASLNEPLSKGERPLKTPVAHDLPPVSPIVIARGREHTSAFRGTCVDCAGFSRMLPKLNSELGYMLSPIQSIGGSRQSIESDCS